VTDPTEILAERYGTGRPRRRVLALVLCTLLAVTLLAWAVWAGWLQDGPAIRADVTSYDVVSDHEVRVKVTAQLRDEDTEGTCLVQATAEDHTVVGEENLTAAELRAATGTWISVRTERRATTATVDHCTG
jgi:hypothetical protein